MVETLLQLQAGTITPRAQNNADATLAPILTKEEGRIDFSRTAQEICNRLRGFQPWPGAFTKFRGKMLGVTAARPGPERATEILNAGQLLMHGSQLFVGCGQNTLLELREVQPEGKKRMAALDFVHGYRLHTCDLLGN
jgi:methionyl-tRNA formyltransferase